MFLFAGDQDDVQRLCRIILASRLLFPCLINSFNLGSAAIRGLIPQIGSCPLRSAPRSRLHHHSRAQDFVFPQRLQGSFGNSDHGDGFAESVENFDGLAFAAVGCDVVLHELDEVAAAQPVLR